MAVETWVTVKTHQCDVLGREASLLERRVYPAAILPDTEPYRVLGHKCSDGLECNLIGCTCKWAYTDSVIDRMAL